MVAPENHTFFCRSAGRGAGRGGCGERGGAMQRGGFLRGRTAAGAAISIRAEQVALTQGPEITAGEPSQSFPRFTRVRILCCVFDVPLHPARLRIASKESGRDRQIDINR